jgi:hypothetical protein
MFWQRCKNLIKVREDTGKTSMNVVVEIKNFIFFTGESKDQKINKGGRGEIANTVAEAGILDSSNRMSSLQRARKFKGKVQRIRYRVRGRDTLFPLTPVMELLCFFDDFFRKVVANR